eukprot:6745402-Pyramimonas_sp.AAC.1
MTSSSNIDTGSELLSLTNVLTDSLRATAAAALHPPWATMTIDRTRRHITPRVDHEQPKYVE